MRLDLLWAETNLYTDDPYTFTVAEGNLADRVLTTTKTSGASDAVRVTVWIEGWQPLNTKTIWDEGFINQNFKIDMQFSCTADR